MKNIVRGLYARLTIILVVLLLGIGVIQAYRVSSYWKRAREETQQLTHWALADHLHSRLAPALKDGFDRLLIDKIFRELGLLFPTFDFYLLDASGKVLAFSGLEVITRDAIDLAPVTRALQGGGDLVLPLHADDPREKARTVIFSAAPIIFADGSPGYFYITLDSAQQRGFASEVQLLYSLRGAVVDICLLLLVAGIFGLVSFQLVTRRFRMLHAAVAGMTDGDYSRRVDLSGSDEVGQLAATFNTMAERIEESVRKLEESDRRRRDLVATISHDLRTPLSAVVGRFELLVSGSVSEELRAECLESIANGLTRLQQLIADLFELSKLEARDTQPVFGPVSLSRLVQQVYLAFEPDAEEHGLELVRELPKDLPPIRGDEAMLERLLGNLVSNAIRYTPAGTVTIGADREPDGRLRLFVADTGSGIPEDELGHIFERFYRAEKHRRAVQGGTGLGLAIVKKIAEVHEAELSVESTVGEGTTFSLRLPEYVEEAAAEHPLP